MIKTANLSRQHVKIERSWVNRYKLSSAESLIAIFAFLGNVLLKHMKGAKDGRVYRGVLRRRIVCCRRAVRFVGGGLISGEQMKAGFYANAELPPCKNCGSRAGFIGWDEKEQKFFVQCRVCRRTTNEHYDIEDACAEWCGRTS